MSIIIKFNKQLILFIAVLLGVSCVNGGNGNHSVESVSTSPESPAETKETKEKNTSPTAASVARKAAAPQTVPQGKKLFDFAEQVSLAHIRSGGLLIDMGTEARHKYTLGDWKTGWRGNFAADGVTFSYISGKATRVFFPLRESEAGDGNLVIRARGIGERTTGRLYLNGTSLGTVTFGADYTHVSKEVNGTLQNGNNELLLRFEKGARAADGKIARLAVDYIRVIPKNASDRQAASSVNAVLSEGQGGVTSALLLRKDDDVTYYLPVPKGTTLQLQARSISNRGKVRVTATSKAAQLEEQVIATTEVGTQSVQLQSSLAPCEDEVCSLSIQVTQGEVLFEKLSLWVPEKDVTTAPGKRAATNVVVVLIDTLRADHLSMYKDDTRVQTAFLDKFAKEAMVFDRAWAQENWTKPSIASLLTGLYSASHQTKTEKNKVPQSAVMMQEHFGKLGFETAGFVANGYVSDKFGFKRGWGTWTNYVREGKRNRAEFVADDAVAWLKRRKEDKPFYLYVHTIDPHVPYIPPAKYRALYDNEPYNGQVRSTETANLLEKIKTGAARLNERDKFRLEALYDGEITYHDEHFEKVYRELDAQGLLENTVIVVTADHGEEFFEHGSVGHGHTLYEELLHVPLLIRLPGAKSEKEEAHFTDEVELVDVFPTICDLLGVACPTEVQGESLLPQLKGMEPRWPNAAYSEFMEGQLAARTSRYKLIYRGLSTTLFDLVNDSRETADLSDEHPEALVLMKDLLGIHMGRFSPDAVVNGSSDKPASAAATPKKATIHKREEADIDGQTRKQLEALGYMGD